MSEPLTDEPIVTGEDEDPKRFSVLCPHCGADCGYYADFTEGPGRYSVLVECDTCDKPFALEVDFTWSSRPLAPGEMDDWETP